jgi:hypothetical protein
VWLAAKESERSTHFMVDRVALHYSSFYFIALWDFLPFFVSPLPTHTHKIKVQEKKRKVQQQ